MTDIVWVDYCIIGIVVISALISLGRGFIKESMSLVIWLLAYIVSSRFYQDLSAYFTKIDDTTYRNGAAICALFIGTLILGAIANYIISTLVAKTGLSGTDRILGLCFGAVRGTLIVAALLFVLDTFTPMSTTIWWHDSVLIPEFKIIIQWFYETMAQHSSFLDNTFKF